MSKKQTKYPDFSQINLFEKEEEKMYEVFNTVEDNNIKKMKRLIKADKDIVNELDIDTMMTPLFHVKSIEMARLLIDNGADINHKEELDMTPFIHLCCNKKIPIEIIKYFIGITPDINIKDIMGDTVLNKSITVRRYDIAELLLENGADINTRDKRGNNLLMECINEYDYDNVEAIQFLLKKNIDIFSRNNSDQNILNQIEAMLTKIPLHGPNSNKPDPCYSEYKAIKKIIKDFIAEKKLTDTIAKLDDNCSFSI